MTGKSIMISVSGKRNVGDAGNDYIDSCLNCVQTVMQTGKSATTTFVWTFPNGSVLYISGVVNVTEWGGGDSTAVAPLAFEVQSDGKPEFVEASASE